MGFFGAAHGLRGEKVILPKICHTYPTMMKLDTVIPHLKSSKIYINHVTYPLNFANILRKSVNFVISRNADIDCISIHIF